MDTRDDDVINQSCGAVMHLKRFGYPDMVPTQPRKFIGVTEDTVAGQEGVWTRRFGQRAECQTWGQRNMSFTEADRRPELDARRVNRLPGATTTVPNSFNTHVFTPLHSSSAFSSLFRLSSSRRYNIVRHG
jgi:hypothetical protein